MSEHEQQPRSPNRLRQRLVGGLVVLALAALLLPLWLDNGGLKTPSVQPVPKAPDIAQPAQITIPAPPPAQQQLLQNPPPSALPETEPQMTTKASTNATTNTTEPSANLPKSSPQDDRSGGTGQNTKTSVQGDQSPQPTTPAQKPKPQPKPQTSTAHAPQKHNGSNASGQSDIQPSNQSSQQLWVVQLGSFSDELNAKGLARSVSAAGFKVKITPLFAKKGTVWRVRVGPYTSRQAAVRATTELRDRLGRDGLVMPN